MKKVILIAVLILSIAVYVYAQTTWSDYDELPITEIADGDDFLVRDVSDATIATGIQKRYLWSSLKSDLIDSLIAGDIPDLSGTYQPLDATLTAVAASTLDPITVTQSVTTDADPYTLTPTTGKDRVVILVTTHADNVDISLSETGAVHLETIYIHNLSANTLIMDDVAAVQEIAGHVELEQDNVAVFQYRTDRWVYIGGSADTLFLNSLNMAGGTFTSSYQIITPQSKTYTSDDDDETMGTDITSSVVLVTGDNNADPSSIDLQNGTVAGQIVTFIGVALIDADDTFTIDVATDSTCTGCPSAGAFAFDDPGDKVTLYWSGTAWFYCGSYEVD